MSVTNSALAVSAVSAALLSAFYFYFQDSKRKLSKQWKLVGKVIKLHLYPLKSGRRIELESAECTDFGLKVVGDESSFQLRDRCFIVYGASNNEFKTARTFPKMVLIEISKDDENHLALEAPDMMRLVFQLPTAKTNKSCRLNMRSELIYGLDCGDEAAAWISKYINGVDEGLRLGYHDASQRRDIRKTFGTELKIYKKLRNASTGLYADLSAALLINKTSVDALNKKIGHSTVQAENFRPNIVIEGEGAPAYAEDDWDWIRIGECVFRNVKPCTRCILTTVNPEEGKYNKDKEPLKTLNGYRKLKDIKGIDHRGELPVMGINLEVYTKGIIHVDDEIFIA